MDEVALHDKIIVIGCSLGGFQTLSKLLKPFPQDYPYPIVIVQHRQKHEKSALEKVIQNKTQLTVKQADEKEEIKKAMVYIAPPDYHLLMEDNFRFSLSSDSLVNFSRPSIDVLFETASEACGEKLIAIILSGANEDGARGISKIRKNKGITIAQKPDSAECSIMPEAAIKTGNIQKVLTIEQIITFLLSFYEKK